MAHEIKIACIVCTKDRPEDLKNLFVSFEKQTRKPDQIIIVDGSDTPIKHVLDAFPTIHFDYVTVRPPGLAKQRNVGIKNLRPEMQWIGFMDDDLVLEPDCIEKLEEFILKKPEVKGIGLVIDNQPVSNPSMAFHLYHSIFMTDKEPGGIITKAAMASAIRPVKEDLRVDWLYGGATFWNTQVFKEFKFDEWFSGVGYLEDVDFSYGVSRKYPLMLASSARCNHYFHPVKKHRLVSHGAWHFVAWWYFANKYKFNKILVFWAMIGIWISNLAHGILKPSTHRLHTSWGNIKAFMVIFSGKVSEFKGFQK